MSGSKSSTYPKLAELLRRLKSGLKDSGIDDIYDYLRGRDDKEFRPKTTKFHAVFNPAIDELIAACPPSPHAPDVAHVRFLLWRILSWTHRKHREWVADEIGNSIVTKLRLGEQDRLICIPLRGSMAPIGKEPIVHHLADRVWLFEPSQVPETLISMITSVLVATPPKLRTELESISNPVSSERGSLLLDPLLILRTSGSFSQRAFRIREYGLPLLALYNMVTVNQMTTSDDLSAWAYMTKRGISGWSKDLQKEWKNRCDTESEWGKSFSGMFEPHFIDSISEGAKSIAHYEIDISTGSLSPVIWNGGAPPKYPPLLILSSLFPHAQVSRLIAFGDKLADPGATDLHRRIGHAVRMWTKACDRAQQEEWEMGFEERDERPRTPDPDSLILYSTIVFETLFTSQDHSEITGRIADYTAGILGKDATERFDLARRMKRAYAQRSSFVHGDTERSSEYENTAYWLFKIATLTLWETVRIQTFSPAPFDKWNVYEDYILKRKYGDTSDGR